MEKILLVVNAHKPDSASIDFGCRIAQLSGSRLTGLFIENLYERRTPFTLEETAYFQNQQQGDAPAAVVTDTDQAIKLFVEECAGKNIATETYLDKGEPIREVVYESRFADLLIMDPKMSFYAEEEQLPSHFTKEILANAECPVLLAPEKYTPVDEVVFCFDGSASSVFALKQFTYLFPGFRGKKARLLEVNKSGNEEFNESHRRVLDWLRAHYDSVTYYSLKGRAKDELLNYFFLKTNRLVVMGAYGRGLLSNFFKRSAAEALIRTIDLPIFISHP